MAKQKKKRNKAYTGADAVTTRPSITRVQAVDRGRLGQWWFEKKRVIRIGAIAAAVVTFIVWLIVELVSIVSGR